MSDGGGAGGAAHPSDANLPFPLTRLALERTVRLVSTARLRDPVLLALVDADDLDALAEIEGATSARLRAADPRRRAHRPEGIRRRSGARQFHQCRLRLLAAARAEPLQRAGARRLVCGAGGRDLHRGSQFPPRPRARSASTISMPPSNTRSCSRASPAIFSICATHARRRCASIQTRRSDTRPATRLPSRCAAMAITASSTPPSAMRAALVSWRSGRMRFSPSCRAV